MYDLILRGGRIYDGSGMPLFSADVGINAGCIAAIGGIDGSKWAHTKNPQRAS